MVRLAYDGAAALEVTKKVVRAELEKKGQQLRNQLDHVLGF